MADPSQDIVERLNAYLSIRQIELKHPLGGGKDGYVFSTNLNSSTALKIFQRQETYRREIACYLRLCELNIKDILGHNVPQLLHYDDQCLAIEMTIVQPPFLLDFASAYLDWPPDFDEDVVHEWQQAKKEEFGSRWGRVQILLAELERQCGIYLLDVHPGNITFE